MSPSPAINRKETEAIGRAITIGGVVVKPGEIIMGDEDGLIVIPKECEDDLFANIDGASAKGCRARSISPSLPPIAMCAYTDGHCYL